MSFILDALKKSESERQRQAGPALLEMRIVRPTRRLPIWAVVVGIVLILCVGVLAWVALRPTPVAAPATAAMTQAPPVAAVPASNGIGTPQAAPAGAAGAPATVAPAMSAPAAPAANPTLEQPDSQSSAAAPDNNPADTEPAVVPQAASASESANAASLRTYAELGNSLPELRLDLHVYAANPAERYAFINMHKVREGDATAEGVQVKEITREGVVLSFRGTEFLLGRQ